MNEVEIRIRSRDDTARGAQQAESRMRQTGKAAAAALGAAGAAGGALLAKGIADNMNIEVANDRLAAQLGLTTEEAKKAGEVAGAVYGDNWGGSIEEVNAAIQSVGTNLGDIGKMTKDELQGMTKNALALAQTFDMDVAGSTEAAAAMMKNGLAKNATEAFDIITAGAQAGGNKAGDLLETFTEYSPQFQKLGFDGKYAMDLLSEGLKAGARDTDVIADGFKEFGLRAIDGSKATTQAYKDIGMNAKEAAADIAKGGPAAQVATQQVMDGLLKMKDPIKQNAAGVALFGTTWEDTIRTILPELANADGAIEDVNGSTERMAATVGDNAQGKIDTMKRGFEQWTQEMAASDGALGLVTTGAVNFGGTAVAAGSQIGMMALALRGTAAAAVAAGIASTVASGAMTAMGTAMTIATGPVGLIILAVAAVAIGLVVAYKKSEKFRTVVQTVFKATANVLFGLVDKWLQGFQMMFAVMGKLPGKAGAPFRAAANSVQGMRNKVQALRRDINAIKSKKVTIGVRINTTRAVYGDKGGHYDGGTFIPNRGTGGITGAATGGARGGLTMVGEYGRELVRLPFGSQVMANGKTEAMMTGHGRGGGELTIRWVGGNAGDQFMAWLRKNIRIEGGNVQKVLGQA